MSFRFYEDVIPLTGLKVNPGRVVKHVTPALRPVLLTSRGRGVAVVMTVEGPSGPVTLKDRFGRDGFAADWGGVGGRRCRRERATRGQSGGSALRRSRRVRG